MSYALEKAMSEADYIPAVMQWKIPAFKFIGTVEGPNGNKYYYFDETENKYYVEADIDREMREAVRRNKKKKRTSLR